MVLKRDYKLTVMLSDEEERMLDTMADKRGLTSSDLVRQMIRTAYESDPAFQAKSLARNIIEGARKPRR